MVSLVCLDSIFRAGRRAVLFWFLLWPRSPVGTRWWACWRPDFPRFDEGSDWAKVAVAFWSLPTSLCTQFRSPSVIPSSFSWWPWATGAGCISCGLCLLVRGCQIGKSRIQEEIWWDKRRQLEEFLCSGPLSVRNYSEDVDSAGRFHFEAIDLFVEGHLVLYDHSQKLGRFAVRERTNSVLNFYLQDEAVLTMTFLPASVRWFVTNTLLLLPTILVLGWLEWWDILLKEPS